MPVKRRTAKERQGVSEDLWAFLTDRPMPDGGNPFSWFMWKAEMRRPPSDPGEATANRASAREAWQVHRDEVLLEWIERGPGTRPSLWWNLDAPRQPAGLHLGCWFDGLLPMPRQRVGGVGTPAHDAWCYMPAFHLGLPVDWVTVGAVARHGAEPFRGEPISASNPPRFEAQATYLERQSLLLPSERKRLTEADFAPEVCLSDRLAGK